MTAKLFLDTLLNANGRSHLRRWDTPDGDRRSDRDLGDVAVGMDRAPARSAVFRRRITPPGPSGRVTGCRQDSSSCAWRGSSSHSVFWWPPESPCHTLWRRLSGHAPHWSGVFGLTPEMLFGLGAITGTLAGLFVLGRIADEFALGFRPALDVLLDVDNYLRAHPRERTPRARIAERYATLLRYLCRWENRSAGSSGSRYDAVVIVAHSQGSVITADLLRFLRCERSKNPGFEPDLDRLLSDSSVEGHLPVYFFTMGCPLRQLYRLRFPDLYRWVDATDRRSAPIPKKLGVTRWVNVYRSGDYVGRSLWTPDSDEAHLFVPAARPRTIDPGPIRGVYRRRGAYPLLGRHSTNGGGGAEPSHRRGDQRHYDEDITPAVDRDGGSGVRCIRLCPPPSRPTDRLPRRAGARQTAADQPTPRPMCGSCQE